MKQKFIEWFTKNNNGCSPAMEDDRSFVYEMTQHMFEAYQAGVAEGEARCATLAAELRAVEAIHDEAVFITDDHYEQCPPEVQKMIRSLAVLQIPAYQAFLTEVRAQGVDEFLRGSQLPYQIATVLADYDNVDDATLQTVIWSGQPPEPDGDVWHLEYVSRGNAIVRAVLKELRKGVQQ
ncbi:MULTISPECIES: hypothetical protein [Enterobacter cloacae complex]|uniref:Uncharacterized protein n=2 Tax=Enterobacter cloacae TaxID=550 RepID=A0A0H3CG46_ENTCC|nr:MULTISPECIES: hypothetical protein [Enterobacter cloacae complex]ADF60869.1 hypothetical protein ECL_01308 [Enterobacter cloacae subsp. cloacae ATCC 13047]KGB03746.1 hypothetical protein DR74_455 [Enterobacter cloacae]MCK6973937.1 hypothetical protein [Enterobacter cloacae]MDR9923151.1 hypothetical protein [Enterobacter hormaechei subsp. xiangfangensis]MDS0007968.1 hypothetical protein [Enterobacter hormaechei subsp. xiangfangensis]